VERSLIERLAGVPTVTVEGTWQRSVTERWADHILDGSTFGGRWGRPDSFAVLYLGRPRESVVVEAYRHYVDNEPGMRPELVRPRVMRQCTVRIEQILDLTTAQGRISAGLDVGDLRSAVDDYEACQTVAHAAHQLGRHGILAPAATGLGETLAVFVHQLGPAESVDLVGEPERWDGLPPDPRRLRLIEGSTGW
jgi:RES domain-containing protein